MEETEKKVGIAVHKILVYINILDNIKRVINIVGSALYIYFLLKISSWDKILFSWFIFYSKFSSSDNDLLFFFFRG